MKLIIYIILVGTLFTGCERKKDNYATSCTDIWRLSPGVVGTTTEKGTSKVKTELLSDAYIVRCCELIDGGDNPKEQSSAEGSCMKELLSNRSDLMLESMKRAVKTADAASSAAVAKTAVKEAQTALDKAVKTKEEITK